MVVIRTELWNHAWPPDRRVTATVHPDSFHLKILFARTRRRGLRDVAVAAPMTVGDDALRRCLNRAVMGHRLVGLQGQLRGGIANFVSLPI